MNADANKEAYSFPVERAEFMFVTSPFGMRTDPMDAGKQQMHKGIDIRCKGYAVLATENNGKVVAVNHNANTAGGKSITIEYPRSDGARCRTPICTCLLSMSRWAIPSKPGRKSVFLGIPGHGLPASTCISG